MKNAKTTLVLQCRHDETRDEDDCIYELRLVLKEMNPEYEWKISSLRTEFTSGDGKG